MSFIGAMTATLDGLNRRPERWPDGNFSSLDGVNKRDELV
jgi:hypothetical protein